MPNASRRLLNASIGIGMLLVFVTLFDFLLPGNYLIPSVYAFPMLLAAFHLSPRGTAITAMAAVLLVLVASILRDPPLEIEILGVLGVIAIGGLSVQVAWQRRRAERREIEREQARRQVTEILESIGDGFFALDNVGRFTYINQHAEQFFGRSRDELLRRVASDKSTSGSLAAFQPYMIEARSKNVPLHVEVFEPSRNRWYEVRIFPSETGLSVSFRDSTQRKETEQRLRQAEAQYRSLIEQVPAITYRSEVPIDDVHIPLISPFTFVSPQLETMLGYTVEEWIRNPNSWAERLHPDDRERVLAADNQAVKAGKRLRLEYRLLARDGRVVWVRDEILPISDGANGYRTWQGIIFDITTEKLAEKDRAATARKFAFLAEVGRQMTVTQLDFDQTLKQVADLAVPDLADWCLVYLFRGEKVQRVAVAHARPEDAPLAARLNQLPDVVFFLSIVQQTLDGGALLHLKTEEELHRLSPMPSAEHQEIIAGMQLGSAVIAPLHARGKLLGAMFCARRSDSAAYTADDIMFVDEVAHRFALMVDNARLYQEARRVAASREEFLSAAAHELRTPLTSIKGYTQLLERRLSRTPGAIEAARQMLGSLQPQILRFERIVDDLLDLTRIERGQFSIRPEPCDLVAIARQVFENQRHSAEHNPNQPMHLIVPESLRGTWDPVRIAQVMENLLSNSLRYTLGRGEVLMRIERLAGEAVISVEDQGIGLTPDEVIRVFEPFFRSEMLAGQIAGSGLGLPIAKRIVEQHHGTIEVESEAGVGSTFTVRLPINGVALPAIGGKDGVAS